ncbi:MAG: hypothetical protein HYR68_09785 [Burkholderiales bacterium]|nr:hypothetical protein [Burkholderiales bacterium]MBI3729244.1 hypothetical protein [Burkholderiales bacterium]
MRFPKRGQSDELKTFDLNATPQNSIQLCSITGFIFVSKHSCRILQHTGIFPLFQRNLRNCHAQNLHDCIYALGCGDAKLSTAKHHSDFTINAISLPPPLSKG